MSYHCPVSLTSPSSGAACAHCRSTQRVMAASCGPDSHLLSLRVARRKGVKCSPITSMSSRAPARLRRAGGRCRCSADGLPGAEGGRGEPAGVTLPIFVVFGGWWGLAGTRCLLPRESSKPATPSCAPSPVLGCLHALKSLPQARAAGF